MVDEQDVHAQDSTLGVLKVPAVTLLFWAIKIGITTLGETAGDAVSMTLEAGYALGSVIFASFFAVTVYLQMRSKTYRPEIYWLTMMATTTVGTTLADFADRSLGVGYFGGSLILLSALLASLFVWWWRVGTTSMDSVTSSKAELHYWITIMASQTLGTALGDWLADTEGFGFVNAAVVFGGLIGLATILYFTTKVSRVLLFWVIFVLTRPLGAVLGDFLDKPIAQGGLALGRIEASLVLLALTVALIVVSERRPRPAIPQA